MLVEEQRAKARERERIQKLANESVNWYVGFSSADLCSNHQTHMSCRIHVLSRPSSKDDAKEHNIANEAHWNLLTTLATPRLQAAFRRHCTRTCLRLWSQKYADSSTSLHVFLFHPCLLFALDLTLHGAQHR